MEQDSSTLRLAVLPTTDCLPFYVADRCGIFDSLGIDVQLVTFDAATDCDTALAGGSVDGTVSDVVKAIVMRSEGDSVKAVMSTGLHLYLLSAKNARIKRTNGIKEKIIAITRNSALDLAADKILESVKLGSEELNKPQINHIQLRAGMLDQNQYDGAILPEPYASASAAKGAVRLAGTDDFGMNLSAVIFREDAIAGKKEQIKALAKAYDHAVALIADIAGKENTAHTGKGKKNGLAALMESIPSEMVLGDTVATFILPETASLPDDSIISTAIAWAKGRSLIKNEIKYEDVVDTTFLSRPAKQ